MGKKKLNRKQELKGRLIELHGGRCLYCGEAEPVTLDFHHHIRPKLFKISGKELSRSVKEVLAEAAKCHLLCSNHHRMVHMGLLYWDKKEEKYKRFRRLDNRTLSFFSDGQAWRELQ